MSESLWVALVLRGTTSLCVCVNVSVSLLSVITVWNIFSTSYLFSYSGTTLIPSLSVRVSLIIVLVLNGATFSPLSITTEVGRTLLCVQG